MSEHWYKLLAYWQEHELRHSLTFPFLIGALRDPVGATLGYEGKGLQELQELVSSMQSHKANDHILHVYRCGDRDKLVVTRIKSSGNPSYGVAIPPADGGQAVLYTSHETSLRAATPSSLVAAIWRECADAVEQGLFSCRGRTFQQFDATEHKIIQSALA